MTIFARFQQRNRQRMQLRADTAGQDRAGLDAHETFEFERDNAPWPTTTTR